MRFRIPLIARLVGTIAYLAHGPGFDLLSDMRHCVGTAQFDNARTEKYIEKFLQDECSYSLNCQSHRA